MSVEQLMQHYADQGFFLEILADGYKNPEQPGKASLCWRGYVNYNPGNRWIAVDLGCYATWELALGACKDYVEGLTVSNPVKWLDEDQADLLKGFPNFSNTGSVSGMKRKYYGQNALLVECGSFIYNVTAEPRIYYRLAELRH